MSQRDPKPGERVILRCTVCERTYAAHVPTRGNWEIASCRCLTSTSLWWSGGELRYEGCGVPRRES